MNLSKKICLFVLGFSLGLEACAQSPSVWTLKKCLEYAHANNLQIKQADISIQESEYSRKQGVAALFPSVSASTSFGYSRQNVRNSMNEYMSDNSINARYNIGANMTVFNGLKQYNNLKQQDLNIQLQQVNKEDVVFRLDLSIIQAYTQIAYLKENIILLESGVASSKAQLELAEHKLKAGSISQSDRAQIASQYSNDCYQLVCGQNQLNEQLLKLKQLLELGMDESISTAPFSVDTDLIMAPLPDKKHVYEQALQQLPSSRSQEINVQIAELNRKIANAGYSPSLSLSASVGTGNWFDGDESFSTQLNDNLNESIGLSLSIPIFNGLQTRTAVQKAKLNQQNVQLNKTTADKELLSTIESLYNDALAAQSQYMQAKAQLEAATASHRLVEEQFKLGLKNTVELLISDNTYLNASQNLLQTKYTAALAIKLLQYYQGLPIE